MKDNEKKVNKPEKQGAELPDEQLAHVTGGKENAAESETQAAQKCELGFLGLK